MNKDGTAEILYTSYARNQATIVGGRGIVPGFDYVFLFQAATAGGVEVEISSSLLVFRDGVRLEGQGCAANLKETLRAESQEGKETLFFRSDSAFGRAYLGFYQKHGATDAQLTDLIPRFWCADGAECKSLAWRVVPSDLELRE